MELQKKQTTFSPDQISLIKSQVAQGATDDELKMFLHQCQRTGLDPLTRQIYFIKRSGRMTIQTSIDGFRLIAERSGSYAGQDAPVWTYNDNGEIINCTVTVYRFGPGGQRYPAGVGVAFYKEYYPNPQLLQKSLAHTMIAKVAEALALRKAFPQDLSGLYTGDEMQQAEPLAPTDEMKEELIASMVDLEMDEETTRKALDSINNCRDIAQFQKIKFRLSQFPKAEIIIDSPKELLELKPKPKTKKNVSRD